MPGSSFFFDPEASGSAVFLGPTESKLMELIWRHKRLTVKKALYSLGPENVLAYTTVMTVLNRLTEKGILQKEKNGRNFEYSTDIDKETFLKNRVAVVMACLSRNFEATGR